MNCSLNGYITAAAQPSIRQYFDLINNEKKHILMTLKLNGIAHATSRKPLMWKGYEYEEG